VPLWLRKVHGLPLESFVEPPSDSVIDGDDAATSLWLSNAQLSKAQQAPTEGEEAIIAAGRAASRVRRL
jgi:hypothetical protein